MNINNIVNNLKTLVPTSYGMHGNAPISAKNPTVLQNGKAPLANVSLDKLTSYDSASSVTMELKSSPSTVMSPKESPKILSRQVDGIDSSAKKIPTSTEPGYYRFGIRHNTNSLPSSSITSKTTMITKSNYQEVQNSSLSFVQEPNNRSLATNDNHLFIKTNSCNSPSCSSTNCAKVIDAPCKVDPTLTIVQELTHNLTTYPPNKADSRVLDNNSNACGDEKPQSVIRETSETIQNKEIVVFTTSDAPSRWLQEDATFPKIASYLPEKSLALNNILNNWEDGTQI